MGAEAEAVRISRLVGLVCCECHIAMFFFGNLLGTMVFLFHADNNVSEFFTHTTRNEAVRISRLVGLVCCECHIATFFFANLLGTMVFLFHADNNVSEFFRHTTQNGSKGAFSVLLRKVWLTGFRTVHNMVGSGGPKCPCGRWLSSLRRQDLARQWQAWPDGPDRESLSMPVLLVCVGDRVFLFFGPSLFGASLQEWEHIKWRQHGGLRYWNLCLECHRHVWGTDGRTSNRYCRPRCLPCPRLPAGELFVREPPPELAPCSHFCFPCSTMGSPTGNFF